VSKAARANKLDLVNTSMVALGPNHLITHTLEVEV